MEINVQAQIGLCAEFMGKNDQKSEISVVISPLKVTSNEDESKIAVVMGCNMWKSCRNADCWYSIAARNKAKASTTLS